MAVLSAIKAPISEKNQYEVLKQRIQLEEDQRLRSATISPNEPDQKVREKPKRKPKETLKEPPSQELPGIYSELKERTTTISDYLKQKLKYKAAEDY